jgi:hypothetical protein
MRKTRVSCSWRSLKEIGEGGNRVRLPHEKRNRVRKGSQATGPGGNENATIRNSLPITLKQKASGEE